MAWFMLAVKDQKKEMNNYAARSKKNNKDEQGRERMLISPLDTVTLVLSQMEGSLLDAAE